MPKYMIRATMEVEASNEQSAIDIVHTALEGMSPDIEDGPDPIEDDEDEDEDEDEEIPNEDEK